MLCIFLQFLLLPALLSSDPTSDDDSSTIDEEDSDPIDEDLFKVDLSKLEVISREKSRMPQHDCEYMLEEIITYRYNARTKSGGQREIHLGDVVSIPIETTKINYHNNPDGIEGVLELTPHLNCFDMDSPILIEEIKKRFIPPNDKEYDIGNMTAAMTGEVGQPVEVDQLVFGGQLKNGFFIEAGAADGELQSDTLYYEINHGWTGLLIEPNPIFVSNGTRKNRKATWLSACLSTDTKPQIIDFDFLAVYRTEEGGTRSMGGIVTDGRDTSAKVQCLPLYSILLAHGNPTVNYFSLDVEGAEFAILKTVPWDKVDIQVLSIETHMLGSMFPGTREELIEYMESVGYNHIKDGHKGTNEVREELGTTDDMFVKKGVPLRGLKDEL